MAGRKAIPVEIHRLKGTYQPSRHKPVPSTNPDHGTPDRPETLSDAGKAAWARFVAVLSVRRVLTIGDAAGLEVLSETFAEWCELKTAVRTLGRTYACTTSSGATMIRPRPEVAMLADAARRLNVCLAEFGLSPASRGKIPARADAPAGNKFAALREVN